MNIDDKLDRQFEHCEDVFVKRPNVVGIILTVLSIVSVCGGMVGISLQAEKRTAVIETKIPQIEQQVNECKSRIDKIDVMNAKLDTLINRMSK